MKPRLRWRLKEVLDREGIAVYTLAKHLGEGVSMNTVYHLARAKTRRPDLDILARILVALRSLTGRPYSINDILVLEEADEGKVSSPRPTSRRGRRSAKRS